ncbi:MAG: hypothetical protein ACK559_38055, partial [bacterium]
MGKAKTAIRMAGQNLSVTLYVVRDITTELLVGSDFLKAHSAQLDYANMSVSYNKVVAELAKESEDELRSYIKSD